MRYSFCLMALLMLAPPALAASALVEPSLHVAPSGPEHARIALTFDACDGRMDERILSALVDNRIPATIFVTAKWLRRNPAAIAVLHAHPDLFEIEDHGARHVPAVDHPARIFGVAAAGSAAAVQREVEQGADAVRAAGFAPPRWFRGATAKYTPSSIKLIRSMGLKVAGYSVNGDGGASLGAAAVERRFVSARDGDVIIAHINQPHRPAGNGVVRGLLALKRRGVVFVRLNDGPGAANAGS